MFSCSLTLCLAFAGVSFRFWHEECEPYRRQEWIVCRFKEEYRIHILDSKSAGRPDGAGEWLYERLYQKNRERITVLAIRGKGSRGQGETAELNETDMRDLMRMPFLDSAVFSDCRLPPDELVRFLSSRSPSLRIMEFCRTNLDDLVLDQLPELPGLPRLELKENELSHDAVGRFLEKCPNLDTLALRPKQGADYRAGLLEQIGELKKLRVLSLGWFEPLSAGDMEPLVELPKLISVEIEGKLSSDGFASLCRFETVTELHLFDTELSDADLLHLQPARDRLCFPTLFGNPFTGDGLSDLGEMPRLRWLNLSRTQLTDDVLARLPYCPNLEFLFVSETGITDAGLTHLAQLPKLGNLDVSNTAVTDACLETLAKISSLKYVTAFNTAVDPKKLSEFNRSRR